MMTDLMAGIRQPPWIIRAHRGQGDERDGQPLEVADENRVVSLSHQIGGRVIPRYGRRGILGLDAVQWRGRHRHWRIPVNDVTERLRPAAPDHFIRGPEHRPERFVVTLIQFALIISEHPPDQFSARIACPAGRVNPSGTADRAQTIGDRPQLGQRTDDGGAQDVELGGVLPGYVFLVALPDPFIGRRPEPVEPPARLLDPDLPEKIPAHAGGVPGPRRLRTAGSRRQPARIPKLRFSRLTA